MTSRPGLPLRFTARSRPADGLYAAAAVALISRATNTYVADVLRTLPDDDQPIARMVLRTATAPTSSTDGAVDLVNQAVVDAVVGLAPASAVAGLVAGSLRIDLSGHGGAQIPGKLVTAADAGGFVAEGAPITVIPLSLAAGPVVNQHKLCVIATFSNELLQRAARDVLVIVRQVLNEAWALALDAAVLGTDAATLGLRPAGLLNSLAPLAASVLSGGEAVREDIATLVGALAASGGGTNPIFICAPTQAVTLRLLAGPLFNYPVLASAALTTGTIAVVEGGSLAIALADPQFDVSSEALLHEESTTPLAIGTEGTPATVAAPARSLFQTDATGLRMILRCGWGMRATGHVQFISGVAW